MKWPRTALFLCCIAMPVHAQDLAFEVASIHEDKGPFKPPSFALSTDESFREPNGRFHADFALPTYIQFAWKLWLTGEELTAMLAKLPDWVKTERFDIEATAPLHATKDQYRLMMRALLAERFGLKLHFEQRELPVLAMVLTKAGKPGPRLIPHEKGLPCDEKPKPETWPEQCYSFVANNKDGLMRLGSRAASMDLIAKFAGTTGEMMGEIGRPVVDQTGLTGLWDFTLEIAPPAKTPSTDAGPTVLEALQDQLGIKLTSTHATISVVLVDHLDRPSEN